MKYGQKGAQGVEQSRVAAETDASVSRETMLCTELLRRLIMEDVEKAENLPKSAASNRDRPNEIDLVELLYYLLTKLHYIVVCAVVCAILAGIYASVSSPVYKATSKLYIVGQTGSSLLADLQVGSYLTMDYQEVFRTWEVHQMVNDELGTDYSYSSLQNMLTVDNPEDTQILYITVENADAEMAADIANAYGTAAKQFITETMGTDEPSTFSVALVPSVTSNRSITSYVIRGCLLGTVLALGVFMVFFLMDSRPKSPEDIMKCAGIPTLGVIPIEFTQQNREVRRNR